MPAVEVKGLTKVFDGITAVDDLSLTVNHGEMFGLVGPDGAGKTTTLRMLCTVLLPTHGTATILDYDLQKDPSIIKKKIGYLSQRFSLYGDLTVDENIEFFAEINEVYDYHARREELLEFTRLTQFRNRLAENLSGGMKQKLALACTLIHRPKIIFLDEPTMGVDPVSRRDFWKILSELQKSTITIIMTTPYLDEAERCTRIALMNAGRLMVVDTPQKIKQLMSGEVIEIVCEPIRYAIKALKDFHVVQSVQVFGDRLNIVVENSQRDFPFIKHVLQEAGIEISEWRTIQASLENVFISLMSKETVQS